MIYVFLDTFFMVPISIAFDIMGEELNWKMDPRSIGIMEDDEYLPIIMFNFRVTAYISGPGTQWSGYEVNIKTTDGPEFMVAVEVSDFIIQKYPSAFSI